MTIRVLLNIILSTSVTIETFVHQDQDEPNSEKQPAIIYLNIFSKTGAIWNLKKNSENDQYWHSLQCHRKEHCTAVELASTSSDNTIKFSVLITETQSSSNSKYQNQIFK